MPPLKLRKALLKPGLIPLLDQLAAGLGCQWGVYDLNQTLIGGAEVSGPTFPITVENQVLGYLQSSAPSAEGLAQLLSFVCREDLAQKSLARETLQRYEEVNFLSDFAGKIAACANLEDVVKIIDQELQQSFPATATFILLTNVLNQTLDPISFGNGAWRAHLDQLRPLFERVMSADQAEILNNICQPDSSTNGQKQIASLICAPLKIQNQTIGVLGIGHHDPIQYSSEDLNILLTCAPQIAAAIQTAQYYETLKEYSLTLEHRVTERTLELELAKKELELANQELERLAIYDELTGIPNRRYFNQYLAQEWRHCLREQTSLSLIVCDVDYFKRYNDCYGHPAGDQGLRQVAQVISRSLRRSTDFVARYGGEEFVIVLPYTQQEGAYQVALRIQENIALEKIVHDQSPLGPHLTVSLGIASAIPVRHYSPQALLKLADQALYEAKAAGRNQ
ncbi:MAG: diguanylate cyclase, partial [Cyanobacteriota bacterium]|nr:diguanylate cyclase [Cyanobacteriota bacterium]